MTPPHDDIIYTADPRAGYLSQKTEIDAAIGDVLAQPNYILGSVVEDFESAFADYCGVRHGIGVSSGTDAIHLALRGLGIGEGDEVITVSHTSIATVAAIEMSGARPVLVEVDPEYWTIDPAAVAVAAGPRTKAVIAVHLYGQLADIAGLSKVCDRHNLALVEDCAQAHGATMQGRKAGSFGIVSCFSFYPSKNLGTVGDGGMILTNNAALAARLRMLRQYGWDHDQKSVMPGWNSRLGPLQASILQAKLKYLDLMIERRRAIADRYLKSFPGLPMRCSKERDQSRHARHLFVVKTANLEQRNSLKAHLFRRRIVAGIHYPTPVHRQPAYSNRISWAGLRFTEDLASTVLSLPIFPEMTEAQQRRVIAGVKEFFGVV